MYRVSPASRVCEAHSAGVGVVVKDVDVVVTDSHVTLQ